MVARKNFEPKHVVNSSRHRKEETWHGPPVFMCMVADRNCMELRRQSASYVVRTSMAELLDRHLSSSGVISVSTHGELTVNGFVCDLTCAIWQCRLLLDSSQTFRAPLKKGKSDTGLLLFLSTIDLFLLCQPAGLPLPLAPCGTTCRWGCQAEAKGKLGSAPVKGRRAKYLARAKLGTPLIRCQ